MVKQRIITKKLNFKNICWRWIFQKLDQTIDFTVHIHLSFSQIQNQLEKQSFKH